MPAKESSADGSTAGDLKERRPSIEKQPCATAPADASSADAGEGKVSSEEVCESIKKGMRIISDIEQTRADGMVFKFELDLMYQVRDERGRAQARGLGSEVDVLHVATALPTASCSPCPTYAVELSR